MNRLEKFCIKNFKSKCAQQLVEFLLIAPFMVIILGLLTEYAYALNINMTLTEGLKDSTAYIYKEIKPNMPASDISNLVKTNLIDYLNANNVPTGTDNEVTVAYTISGNNAVFMASYKYIPAFTLPNIYFHILPEQFNFLATSLIPAAFLQGNSGYSGGYNSSTLDAVFKGSNFSGLSTYDGVRNGILNKTKSDSVPIIFLVPVTTKLGASTYAVVGWNGSILGAYDIANLTDGKMYTCTDSTSACSDAGKTVKTYFGSCNNIIFVHDSAISSDISDLISTSDTSLDNQWITGTGTTIADKNTDGVLKRTLALIDTNKLSTGNYDNINIFSYNKSFPASNTYSMDTSGSRIFIHTSSDDYSNIK